MRRNTQRPLTPGPRGSNQPDGAAMSLTHSNQRIMRLLQATPAQLAAIDRVLLGASRTGEGDEAKKPAGPVLIRIRTAATMLDAHRATVWRMVRAGKLAAVEILPGSYRVRRDEVEAIGEEAEMLKAETLKSESGVGRRESGKVGGWESGRGGKGEREKGSGANSKHSTSNAEHRTLNGEEVSQRGFGRDAQNNRRDACATQGSSR